jgi:acyl-CoA oxidase
LANWLLRLGHGSFVGGIETTATFDPSTDEFVVNSPSLSSTKYWPGALGYIATHSITMARLIIDKKDHGIHAFVMQIRSLPDGKPMLGCELGDIGFDFPLPLKFLTG